MFMVERISVKMTAKKYVQAIHPDAKCIWVKVLPNEFEIFTSTALLGWGTTAMGAWAMARNFLVLRITQKLEN